MRDITQPQVIADILTSLGQPATELLARAQEADNKEQLRRNTEAAIALGIFGAPSFVVDRELFWGNDRLEDAIAWAPRRAGA